MAFTRERQVSANGLDFFVAEAGVAGLPLVLCLHGFPECWASWRYQLPVLAQSGYYAVAPDLRGYGFTDAPKDVEAYRQSKLVEDVMALIRVLGYDSAILIGHDWGCALAWQVARCYPKSIKAVIGMSVPYGGPAPVPPTAAMRKLFEDRFFYMLYFQQTGLPEQELEADVSHSLRCIFHALSADGIADFNVKPDDTGFLQSMPNRVGCARKIWLTTWSVLSTVVLPAQSIGTGPWMPPGRKVAMPAIGKFPCRYYL
jgi:pimeloyl-ACP methyl ester carboxylesterase